MNTDQLCQTNQQLRVPSQRQTSGLRTCPRSARCFPARLTGSAGSLRKSRRPLPPLAGTKGTAMRQRVRSGPICLGDGRLAPPSS